MNTEQQAVMVAKECADHAALNPGTLRIEDMSGNEAGAVADVAANE